MGWPELKSQDEAREAVVAAVAVVSMRTSRPSVQAYMPFEMFGAMHIWRDAVRRQTDPAVWRTVYLEVRKLL